MNPRRVLVIDDNVHAAETLAVILGHWGYEVRVAFNGEAGLVAAGEFQPRWVLIDIQMPGIDGHEVARRLRQRPDAARVVLVSLTGEELTEPAPAASGFEHHLSKPLNLKTLERLLARDDRLAELKAGATGL